MILGVYNALSINSRLPCKAFILKKILIETFLCYPTVFVFMIIITIIIIIIIVIIMIIIMIIIIIIM